MNVRLSLFFFASIASGLVACGGGATIGSGGGSPVVGSTATPVNGASATPGPSAAASATVTAGATQTPSARPTTSAQPTSSTAPTTAPTSTASTAAIKLARYAIDPKKIFVAGISSGGFGAVQMHVAHSAVFKGAAIYAGGVYWCAQGATAGQALASCGGETISNGNGGGSASYASTLVPSEAYLDQESSMGTIDPESNLKGEPVYLWSGADDEVVNPKEMADLDSEYLHYGSNVHFDSTYPADHGWESPDGELPCGMLGSPYMLACSNLSGSGTYDSVQTWLTMFLGTLQPRNDGALQGTISSFDQTEFGANASGLSLANTGSIFVPKDCAAGKTCGFILAEHGCLQEASLIGTKWVAEAGIDEWADTNDLVVLYPDTVPDAAGSGPVLNPNACFDWWGYSNGEDVNYALKSGAQMSVLYAMVQRVTGAGT